MARRLSLDANCISLATVQEQLVLVCRLPCDPILRMISPSGKAGYGYPYSVLVGSPSAGFVFVEGVRSSAEICVDGKRVWLVDNKRLIEVDPKKRVLRKEQGTLIAKPIAILANQIIDFAEEEETPMSLVGMTEPPAWVDSRDNDQMIRFTDLGSGSSRAVIASGLRVGVQEEQQTAQNCGFLKKHGFKPFEDMITMTRS